MNKTVHTIAGAVPFLILTVVQPTGFEFMDVTVLPSVSLLASAFASPLPDFDTKPMHYSQGKKGLAKVAAKGASKVVNKATGGHRGITHTLLFPAIFFALLYYINATMPVSSSITKFIFSIVFGLFSGWTLHIFADLFNGKGCPIFWPLIQSKLHIMDIPSVGFVPYIWLFMYSTLCLIIIC